MKKNVDELIALKKPNKCLYVIEQRFPKLFGPDLVTVPSCE